jgi:hypothetical protein
VRAAARRESRPTKGTIKNRAQKMSKNVKKAQKSDGLGFGFRSQKPTVVSALAPLFSSLFTFFIASLLSHSENEEKVTVSLTFRQLTSSRLQRKILKKCDFLKKSLAAKTC